MDKELTERIAQTGRMIDGYMEKSKKTMLQKNADRGDCWRNSGLLGQFVEIHSMYFRLRRLIWDMGPPELIFKDGPISTDWDNWVAWADQVENALEDMRNFTMLAEMCLKEGNFKGDKYTKEELE